MRSTILLSAAIWLVAGCSASEELAAQRGAAQSGPVFLPGNPSCADLGLGSYSSKVDPPSSGTYALDGAFGGTNEVTIVVDGLVFDWSATLGIDAVIVKGGPDANLYLYDPEATSNAGEPGLHAPVNPDNGMYFGLSHIELCFDYEVAVAKTANPSFERAYSWAIDKTSTVTALRISEGQVFAVPYQVEVAVTGHVDGDFRVGGAITVANPAPVPAVIVGVMDALDGLFVAVDCGVSFPLLLAPGATLTCAYAVAVPDASTRTNVVEVVTEGIVGGGSASDVADFAAEAVMAEVDACVEVIDDLAGPLGTACAWEAPRVFAYTHDVGPLACGEHEVVNVAAFVASDTGAAGSDAWTVPVTVPCDLGCTLTPGYWKTHSEYGPASYDDTWALLPAGADTPFFLSGQSYYEVLWTPPVGNAYYVLAHAYVAAELNGLNGASLGAVQGAFEQARDVLSTYAPASIGALRGGAGSELRAYVVALATTLDAYNGGGIGPGHCDE